MTESKPKVRVVAVLTGVSPLAGVGTATLAGAPPRAHVKIRGWREQAQHPRAASSRRAGGRSGARRIASRRPTRARSAAAGSRR